jgi:hypothetical protein
MPAKTTILQSRFRNRGTAFTLEQRAKLGITGRLPAAVETLDEQAASLVRWCIPIAGNSRRLAVVSRRGPGNIWARAPLDAGTSRG